MDRKTFLNLSSLTAAATINPFTLPLLSKPPAAGFALKILATEWGYRGSLEQYLEQVKKDGYDGIEIWWPKDAALQRALFEGLRRNQLEVGFLCAGHEADFDKHLNSFRSAVEAAAGNAQQRPLYINLHSGKDYFSFEQNNQLIQFTLELAKKTGIKICHETHRSRMLYSAPAARQILEKVPDMRITLDISHWYNVSESFLQDQASTVDFALQRVDHIHARIGHTEGPQVNDPRAPEWANAVKAHLDCWDRVVEAKKKSGDTITFLTEFGPPDYMPVLPYTRQPLADQWAINVYMKDMLRKRYA